MLRTVRGWLGAVRRRARSRIDGALHERRRSGAREVLHAAAPVRSVLVVCLGNVCRSPYAEARLRALSDGEVEVASCGFIGPGRPMPPEALAEARERGFHLEAHRSRLVTAATVERADLVVLVDPAHRRRLAGAGIAVRAPVVHLGDLDPLPVERRSIEDPWGGGPETFQAVFDRIDRCTAALMEELR